MNYREDKVVFFIHYFWKTRLNTFPN